MKKHVTVIWIDWYAYHVARLRALADHVLLRGRVSGIEMVGGCGMHDQLNFRSLERGNLPLMTLLPNENWRQAGQRRLSVRLWRTLREVNPSVLFVPGYYTVPAVAAALWAKLHRRTAVLMCETTRADRRRVWVKEWTKRVLVRFLFDRAIAGGKRQICYLRELGFAPETIAGGYDVVDNEFYATAVSHARASINPGTLNLPKDYFLFAGRLAPEKNVAGLVRSFTEYCETGGSWSLVLAGDGPLRLELSRQVRTAGIAERVQFVGLKDSRELATLYAFARCFVLPSVLEPWGLVVNEAMASGLPVIVSNRCGCADDLVKHGSNGFVFDPFRKHELISHLHRVSTMNHGQLARMGERSKEIIGGYSLDAWASEVARLAGD
jgi:glycosyltransferase involved in cell wall biosynthesis